MTHSDEPELPARAANGLTLVQLVVAAGASAVAFALCFLVLLSGRGIVENAILNMLMIPSLVASIATGVLFARRVRALQERRLRAALAPAPKPLPSTGSTTTSTGVRSS
jgi:hypothetical protein